MTRTVPDATMSVLVLPHGSLSRTGLIGFLIAQGFAIAVFAVLAAVGGNVFAPGFAILAMWFVAFCLLRIWRKSGTGQIVTITPSQLDVALTSGEPKAHFHPYWTKVRLQPSRHRGWPTKLLIGSHGREVEIGEFLNDEERRELAQRIKTLLRAMQDRSGDTNLNVQGDSE